MRRLLLLGVVLSGLAAAVPPAAAEPASERAQRLIERLGSEEFADREQATAALDALGADALPALRAGLNHPDQEVRRRCGDVLERVERRCLSAAMLRPARLRLCYRDQPLKEVLRDVSRRTGYRVQLAGAAAHLADRRVTLDTGEADCWGALDRFFQLAGLTDGDPDPKDHAQPVNLSSGPVPTLGKENPDGWRLPGEARRLVVRAGKERLPTFTSGALRLRALPPPCPCGMPPPGGGAPLTLEVRLQPGMDWLGVAQVRVDRALDEHGQPLPCSVVPRPLPAEDGGFVYPPAPKNEITFSVHPGGGPTPRLRELRGTLTGLVRREGQPLADVGLRDATGRSFPCAGGGSLRVRAVVDEGDGMWRVELDAEAEASNPVRLAVIPVKSSPGRVLVSEKEGTCPFTARDAAGARVRLATGHYFASPDGDIRSYTLYFQAARDQGDPVRLEFVGPRTALVEVPFVLRDVPLTP